MSEDSPYKPPQDDEVPLPSKAGTYLRAVLALLGVVALAVAFLTREIWLGWLTDDPVIAWVAGVSCAGVFLTWLRSPFFRTRSRVRPPRRLRNRYR